MKVSLQQITLAASNGTFNITDPAITSDWKGAIFFGGQPTANATTTGGFNYSIGAMDAGGRNACFSGYAQDATSAASCGVLSSATFAWTYASATAQQTTLAYSAAISNGVTVTQASTGGAQHLVNVLMFAGSDIEFAVSSATFATSSDTITHNLTGTPDCVLVLSNTSGSALFDDREPGGVCVGFYDGTNSVGFGSAIVSAANPTNVAARCGTTNVGEYISQTPADVAGITISAVGASTLTLSTGGSNRLKCVVIAWRHTSGTSAASAFSNTTPAATGNNTVNSGMGVAPQLWLSLSTRLTSTAFTNSDAAGSWGFCAAVNNAGTTQQASISGSFENAVSASSVAKTYISNSTASQTLSDTGTVAFASTIASWNGDGITENVGTAGASAFERINLAYGAQASTAKLLQSVSVSNAAATSITATLGSTTKGSFLVAYVGSPTTGRTCSAKDSVNGNYNTDSAAASSLSICTFANNAGGALTVTGVISGAATNLLMIVEEWGSGGITSTSLDQTKSNSGSAATSGTTGTTATLAAGKELCLVALVTNNDSGTPLVVSPPFLQSNSSPVAIGATTFLAAGNNQPPSTPGVSATFTWPTSEAFRACIATYQTSALGPTLTGQTTASTEGQLGANVGAPLTNQGISAGLRFATPGNNVDVFLAGQTMSSVEGGISSAYLLAPQTIVSAEGVLTSSFSNNVSLALGPINGTFAVGVLADNIFYLLDNTIQGITLAAQVITSSEGMPSQTVNAPLTVQTLASAEGTVTDSLTTALTAETITSVEGMITLQAGSNINANLAPFSLISAFGTIGLEADYFPTAQTLTSTEGTVTFSVSGQFTFALLSQLATFSQGSILTTLVQPFSYPNITGIPLDEATQRLEQSGAIVPAAIGYFGTWPISVQWVPSQTVPPFVVMAQSPPAGTGFVVNNPITLTVSQPSESVSYP